MPNVHVGIVYQMDFDPERTPQSTPVNSEEGAELSWVKVRKKNTLGQVNVLFQAIFLLQK